MASAFSIQTSPPSQYSFFQMGPVCLRRVRAYVPPGVAPRLGGGGAPGAPAPTVALPIGLPWLGAHFRMDALAAFFLIVVNLGGAASSFYGLGYGTHETAPHRVLPFFPAFLAAMNLVVLADDAFSFLLSWEFMSLTSWALVMAHHRERDNARAGYIYLVMASFGTLALLLAFGLLAGPAGGYAFDAIRAAPPSAGEPAPQQQVPPSPALPEQGPPNLPALPTDSGPWIPENVAVLQGLDKVTARVSSFDAPLDKPVHFGTLEIIPHACFKRPPEEPPENAAFLEIREIKPGEAPVELFTGWMFSTSPALSSLEHPVYDIWVVDCKNDSNSSAPSSR